VRHRGHLWGRAVGPVGAFKSLTGGAAGGQYGDCRGSVVFDIPIAAEDSSINVVVHNRIAQINTEIGHQQLPYLLQ
jgi:hypothetical protein